MTNATPRPARIPHEWPRKTGVFVDHYAWLADRESPRVIEHLRQENAHSDAWFAERAEMVEEIFEEIKSRIKEDDNSVPVLHNGWWYVSSTHAGRSYAVHSRGPTADTATSQLLLDENHEAEGHSYLSVGAWEVSHDNTLLAWSSDVQGDEKYTLRIRHIDRGADLADAIPDTSGGSLAWSSDDTWLFYVVPDHAMRPHQVWRHRVGTPADQDVMVFEETDERFYVGLSPTRSGKWIVIDSASKTTSEVWLIATDAPTDAAVCVRTRQPGLEYQVDDWGDQFAVLTNRDGRDFHVMLAPHDSPGAWAPFIHHEDGQRIVGFDCFADFAVMQRWRGGQQHISLVRRDGTSHDIVVTDEPHEVELDANPEWRPDAVRVNWQSLTVPATVASHDIGTGALSILKRTEVPGVDLSRYVAERSWVRSHDGTMVPLDHVRRRDTPLDATAPCLLYVYGAYEISVPPWFSAARLSLLDRGWVWALAHPRGGGELGRGWYEDGKLLNKKNTFHDTLACARHLGETGTCDPARLVVRGGSAGGLTVGACIAMEPARFAAAIAEVPFVDVVTTMSDPSLPLTVTEWDEWGDPREEPHASYIAGYSPYDNVGNAPYPIMYVTAGLHDPRVSYHEPAKWVARIRHESPGTLVLFTCEMDSGHGGPSGRYAQWRDEARTLTFAVSSTG